MTEGLQNTVNLHKRSNQWDGIIKSTYTSSLYYRFLHLNKKWVPLPTTRCQYASVKWELRIFLCPRMIRERADPDIDYITMTSSSEHSTCNPRLRAALLPGWQTRVQSGESWVKHHECVTIWTTTTQQVTQKEAVIKSAFFDLHIQYEEGCWSLNLLKRLNIYFLMIVAFKMCYGEDMGIWCPIILFHSFNQYFLNRL